MEAINGGPPYSPPMPPTPKFLQVASQKYRFYLDKTTPHVTGRWVGLVVLLLLYAIRVWFLKGACTPQLSGAEGSCGRVLPDRHCLSPLTWHACQHSLDHPVLQVVKGTLGVLTGIAGCPPVILLLVNARMLYIYSEHLLPSVAM